MFHALNRPTLRLLLATIALLPLPMFLAVRTTAQSMASGQINRAFEAAAQEWDVPRDLLATIAYAETHFDDHDGAPSADNGFGLMHLVDNPAVQTLPAAARLLGIPAETLKTNSTQNIRGGAALLRAYADEQQLSAAQRRDLAEWFPIVARYSQAQDVNVARGYADEAYRLLNLGISGSTPEGETISVAAQAVEPKKGKYSGGMSAQALSPDYPGALWAPAYYKNYMVADRTRDYPIKYIVIHTTQDSYSRAIAWFQMDHGSYGPTSANYVIRSRDGEITQTVREKDIAYHAGNWTYNTQSIGIEHEGYVTAPNVWYTDTMYKSSAALTRAIARKYGIPLDRSRIIAHSEVPGATHTDPGSGWNWTYYMQLVRQEVPPPPTHTPVPPTPTPVPPTPTPVLPPMTRKTYIPFAFVTTPWSTIVDNAGSAQFSASSNWDTATYNTQRYSNDYRVASPQAVTDTAWFNATIPTAGKYDVFVWYPSNTAYNAATPFVIKTTTGDQVVHVNQQTNGGKWVSLGTFSFNAGYAKVVGVSRWSSEAGYIIADAIKIVQR